MAAAPGEPGASAEWIEVQRRTFTNWINLYLGRRQDGQPVADLYTDLGSGVSLCQLLEEISGFRLPRFLLAPKLPLQKLDNLSVAFHFLQQQEITLVNMGPADVFRGERKLILGLVWTLIVRYQIGGKAALGTSGGSDGEPSAGAQGASGGGGPQKVLLDWVNEHTGADRLAAAGFPGTGVRNFHTDWQSGMLLAALVESLRPGSFHLEELRRQQATHPDPLALADAAMAIAHQHLQVPRILGAQDMAESPDELAVMTYVALFRSAAAGRLAAPAAPATPAVDPAAEAEKVRARARAIAIARAKELEQQRKEAEALAEARAEADRMREELERMRARQAAIERMQQLERERTEARLAAEKLELQKQLEAMQLQAQEQATLHAAQETAAAAQKEREQERELAVEKARARAIAIAKAKQRQQQEEQRQLAEALKLQDEQGQKQKQLQEEQIRKQIQEEAAKGSVAANDLDELARAAEIALAAQSRAAIAEEERLERQRIDMIERKGPIEGDDGLYRMPDGCILVSPNGKCDLGVVKTAIWYETATQQLKIKVYEARALKPRHIGGAADPYVKIYITPDALKVTKQKTEIARRTLNPVFDQLFSFGIPHEELFSKTIRLAIWDNSGIRNTEMGFCEAEVWTVPWDVAKEDHAVVWYALQPKDLGALPYSGALDFRGGCWKYPDGSCRLSTGALQLPEGELKEDPSLRQPVPTGFSRLKDGCLVRDCDGEVVLPTGAIMMADGNLRYPDGSIRPGLWKPPTAITIPEGILRLPNFSLRMQGGDKSPILQPENSNASIKFGMVCIAARIITKSEQLLVRVVEFLHLPKSASSVLAIGFVLPDRLAEHTKQVSGVRKLKNGGSLVDSLFQFKLDRSIARNQILEIGVYSERVARNPGLIGQIVIPVRDIACNVPENMVRVWHALQPLTPQYRQERASGDFSVVNNRLRQQQQDDYETKQWRAVTYCDVRVRPDPDAPVIGMIRPGDEVAALQWNGYWMRHTKPSGPAGDSTQEWGWTRVKNEKGVMLMQPKGGRAEPESSPSAAASADSHFSDDEHKSSGEGLASASGRPSSVSTSTVPAVWSCQVCTYDNPAAAPKCSMCDKARPFIPNSLSEADLHTSPAPVPRNVVVIPPSPQPAVSASPVVASPAICAAPVGAVQHPGQDQFSPHQHRSPQTSQPLVGFQPNNGLFQSHPPVNVAPANQQAHVYQPYVLQQPPAQNQQMYMPQQSPISTPNPNYPGNRPHQAYPQQQHPQQVPGFNGGQQLMPQHHHFQPQPQIQPQPQPLQPQLMQPQHPHHGSPGGFNPQFAAHQQHQPQQQQHHPQQQQHMAAAAAGWSCAICTFSNPSSAPPGSRRCAMCHSPQ